LRKRKAFFYNAKTLQLTQCLASGLLIREAGELTRRGKMLSTRKGKRGEMNNLVMGQVVELSAHKEKRAREKTQEEYKTYLGSLEDAQLESEAHHLLEEFSGQNFGSDYKYRVQLYFGELSRRAGERFGQAIQKLGSEVGQDM
jgi:hypothetical protein